MKLIRTAAMAGALVSGAGPVHAQAIDGTSGVRTPASFVFSAPASRGYVRAMEARPDPFKLLLIPSIAFAGGARVYGGSVGFINQTLLGEMPIELIIGMRHVDVPGASGSDVFAGELKVQPLRGSATDIAAVLEASHTADVSTSFGAKIALEAGLVGPWSLGASGGLISSRPSGGSATTALSIAGGIIHSVTQNTSISLDASLKNDISGEDDISLTVKHRVTPDGARVPALLVFGSSKHRVVFMALAFVF